jgi:protein-S-isoprenylcysteine O-methyltransferase Ste14
MNQPKLLLTIAVWTAVFFALMIAGAGGIAVFFSHPQFVALLLITVLLGILSLFTSGNLSTGEREDRGNRWVLAAFSILGLLLAFFPAYTDRIDFWTFGGEATRWFGVVLYTLGGALRMWPVFVLGNRFSGFVAIQPGHRLVTGGIYRIIRHPSYLGLLVMNVGASLVFRSGVGILLCAMMLIPLIARIRSEEALLQSEFGAEYDAFRAKTKWRLVPGVY